MDHGAKMKPAEVKRAFKRIDDNMSKVSRILQTGRSTIYRWQDHGTDGCSAILLRLVLDGKVTATDIEAAS